MIIEKVRLFDNLLLMKEYIFLFYLAFLDQLKIVYPTTSFLFPDDSPNFSKIWGCNLTIPKFEDKTSTCQCLKLCKKCGAYRTENDQICPICDSELFYDNGFGKFIFSDILLTKDEISNSNSDAKPFSSIICLAFDMTNLSPLFQSLLSFFTSKEFQNEFAGFGFLISFLVNNTAVFVSRSQASPSENISFDRLLLHDNQSPESFFFTSENLPTALTDAFSIIQAMVLDLNSNDQSFSTLFSELSKAATFLNGETFSIDHFFLFYSTSFPSQFDFRLNFRVHCIKIYPKIIKMSSVDDQPDDFCSDSLISCFQNGWEHCLLSHFDQNRLFAYIKNVTQREISNTVTITVHTSPELEICWVSGSKIISPTDANFSKKSSENKNRNQMTVTITNYPTDFVLRLTFQPSMKYKYERSHLISFQAVFEFANGDVFVSNRIWRKAQSSTMKKKALLVSNEWVDSLNFAPFCMVNLHQQVSLFLFHHINNFFTKFRHRKSLNAIEICNSNGDKQSSNTPRTTTNRSNSTKFALMTKLFAERMATNAKVFTFNWSVNGQIFTNEMNNRDLWESDILGKSGGSTITVPSLLISQKIIELYQTLFLDENSAVPFRIRLEVIFLSMTKGFGYFSALFNELFRALNDFTYFFFPPFFLTKFNQSIQLSPNMTNDLIIAFLPSFIRIELEDDVFQRISEQIRNIKEKYPY